MPKKARSGSDKEVLIPFDRDPPRHDFVIEDGRWICQRCPYVLGTWSSKMPDCPVDSETNKNKGKQ